MSLSLKLRILAKAFQSTCRSACSIHSTRPSPRALAWGCQLLRASLNSTAELCVTKPKLVAAQLSESCCRSSQPMKNNILLVEDDASLAASLQQVLSLAGYNVTVATNRSEERRV